VRVEGEAQKEEEDDAAEQDVECSAWSCRERAWWWTAGNGGAEVAICSNQAW
jgi:hypothetical protein